MRLRSAALLALLLGLVGPVLAGPGLAAEKEGGKKDQKAPEHKVTQSESWVEVDDFYATVVGDGRANGMLMVRVGLDIPDAQMRENVERSMPVLRDAWLRSLMAYTSTHVRLDTQPDVVAIADRLQGITDRALKKKGARILLRQVALRAK
jgi:flagellar basal body-associated protein FliL